MEVSPLSTYNRKEPEPYDQWIRRIRAKWLGDPSPAEMMWRIRVLSTPGYGAELEPYRTEVEELAQRQATMRDFVKRRG